MNNAVTIGSASTLKSTLYVSDKTILVNDVSMNNAVTIGSASTLKSTLYVSDKTTLVDDVSMNNAVTIGGASTMTSTLYVTDATTLNNTLNINGKTTLTNDLSMNGNMMLDGNLDISGDLIIHGNLDVSKIQNTTTTHTTINDYSIIVTDDISLNGDLSISGDASLNGRVDICGNLYAQYPNNSIPGSAITGDFNIDTLTLSEGATMKSTLNVSKTATFDSYIYANSDISLNNSKLYVSNDVSMNNNLTVSNKITATDLSINNNLIIGGNGSQIGINDNNIGLNILNKLVIGAGNNNLVSDDPVLHVHGKIKATELTLENQDVTGVTTTNVGTIEFGDAEESNRPRITTANGSSTNITIKTSNIERLTIDSNGNAKFNETLTISKASTLKSVLLLGGDASLNSKLFVVGDVSMDSVLAVGHDASLNSKLYVSGDVSMDNHLSVGGTISTSKIDGVNNTLHISSDVSMDSIVAVGGDVSLNSKLFVIEDVSMDSVLAVGGDASLNSNLYVSGDVSMDNILNVGGNISTNSVLAVGSDASLNSMLFVSDDVSLNSKLSVGNDASFNSNLTVSGDLTVYGNLDVNKIQNTTTINTTVNDYSIIVSEDISLNNDLNVSGNANIANKLDIQKDGNVTVFDKNIVIGGSVYLSTMVANSIFLDAAGTFDIERSFLTNNDNYTIRSSSYNNRINNSTIASAFVNNSLTWKSAIQGLENRNQDTINYTPYDTPSTDGTNLIYTSNSQGFSSNYYNNTTTQSETIRGEYIEIEFPNYTRIDSYQLYTDTYQVPSYGLLLGYDEPNSRWTLIHTYNKSTITIVPPTSFSFDITESNVITTKKLRFVINQIKTSSNTTTITNIDNKKLYENNVAIRYINFAGTFLDSGISVGAGYSLNTANTSMGFGTLAGNEIGKNNIALGNYTLSQTIASDNIAVGYNSLVNNYRGDKNISIGTDSMLNNYDGTHNTTLGHETGYSNQDGNNNTFIGYHSGYSNVNGNNNTFIGYNTNSNGEYSNSTAIGSNATVSANNQIVIGTSNDTIKIPGTIQIDNAFNNDVSMNSNLYVNGDVSFNSKLFVDGTSTLNSTLIVSDATTLKDNLRVGGTSNFNNTITVNGQTNTNTLRVTNESELDGTLFVTGASTLKSTMNVSKAATMASTLNVTGATTFKSTLNVSKAVTMTSTLEVTGASTLKNTLNVSKATALNSTLDVTGATQLNSLTTNGNIIFSSAETTLGSKNKLQINTGDTTDRTTSIRNEIIDIYNGENTDEFIKIQNNKMIINGSNENDTVLEVTGTIKSSFVTLTTGGTITSSGDSTQQSASILIGTSEDVNGETINNGVLIEKLETTPAARGIKFTSQIDNALDTNSEVTIDGSGNMNIKQNLKVDSSLNVTDVGSAAYIRNLTVNDAATLKNTLNVSKITTLHSTLTVSNASTMKSTLNVSNATTLKNTLNVAKATTLTSTLSVDKATTIKSRLDVSDNVSFNSKLTVSDSSEFKNDIDISGNISIEYGDFTINDVSFNVTDLPTSIIEVFDSNQKFVYSQYSGMERVFNGIYDVSASTTDGAHNVWNVFDNDNDSYWSSNNVYTVTIGNNQTVPDNIETYDTSFSYVDSNGDEQTYKGEYIDTTFPFQIQLNYINIRCDIIDSDIRGLEKIIIVGLIDNSWNEIKKHEGSIRSDNTTTLDGEKIHADNKFYTNKIRIAVNEVFGNQYANISKLRFNGDVLGSKIHIDNANLGIGNVNPRSALEITGNMLLSNSINGENTSGDNVEHGRIMWGGINRDISNNNHSSYIRSYFEDGSYDTSGNLAFGTSDGVNVASDKFVINAKGVNNFITDVSMDSNLMTNGDVSFNNKLYVKNNVWVDGNLGIGTSTPGVVVDISNNGALRIPVGTEGDKTNFTAAKGHIRYNDTNSQFEGYGPGDAWGSLGGVINVAQNTKILAAHPDADSTNNELMFFTNNVERMRIYDDGDVSMNENLTIHGKINNAKIFTNAGSNTNLVVGIGNSIKEPGGSNNTGFGSNVFSSSSMTSDAMYNTAFGNLVLQNITSGNGNSGAGTSSLANTSTGGGNVAMGNGTLRDNTTGSNNTAIGKFALRDIEEGESNSAFGKHAGINIIGDDTVKFNTFLGANTNFDDVDNKYQYSTALGYNAKITDSRQIMLGTASETVVAPGDVSMNGKMYFNSNNNSGGPNKISLWQDSVFGFGTVTNGVKYNTYDYHIFNYRGGNNSDGNLAMRLNQNNLHIEGGLHAKGDVSFNGNLVIGGDLSLNGNLAVVNQQNQTIINTTVNDYSLIVTEDLSLNGELHVSGDASFNGKINGITLLSNDVCHNLIIGNGSISGIDGLNNVGFGKDVFGSNNSGEKNVAIGNSALSSITTGESNVAIGNWSQISNQSGNNNVSIGTQALNDNDTAGGNTAIGMQSLQKYQKGGTTAIGSGSGGSITNGGWGNTFIGYNTGFDNDAAAYTNSTALGYAAKITGDNQIMLGRSDETIAVPGDASFNGDVSMYSTLDVSKATTLKNTLNVHGASSLNSTLYVSKATTLKNTLNVSKATTLSSTLDVTNAATMKSTLNVSKATSMASTLEISGASTLKNTLNVSKASTLSSTLAVTNATTMKSTLNVSKAATMKSTLYVSNTTTLKNTLYVNGASSLNSTLYVNKATTLKTTLNIVGKTTLTNDLSMNGNMKLDGNVDISGDLVLQGNLTVNRETNNNIINTTINDYQLIVSEDLSLNGDLHVDKDASFNQIVDISGDVIIGGQKMNPQRLWTIDISDTNFSKDKYYPVVLEAKDFKLPIQFKITGTNTFSGAENDSYSEINDCTLIGYHRAGGWSDKSDFWNIKQKCHVTDERRFLGIYTSNKSDYNVVIYMRGAYKYEVVTDSPSVKLYDEGYYKQYNPVAGIITSVLYPIREVSGVKVNSNLSFSENEDTIIANTIKRIDLTSGNIDQEYKSGSVGINTGTPNSSYKLDVNGDVNATSYNAASDYRIKENVVPISDTSYNIDNLKPVTYTNIKMEKQDFGVIAHELQEQIPFLVTGEKDGEHHQSVNYNGLIGLLLNEVQQLKKRVQELEQSKP